MLVVDEAYGEFAPWSALELVSEDCPLVVVRTYSKVWSLAGVRLGFAVAPTWMIAELEKVLLPYNLSVPTQLAGTHRARLRAPRWNSASRRWSKSAAGCSRRWPRPTAIEVCPSGANFLMFRVAGDAHELWKRLLAHDVLVRDFSSWPRIEGCLRVTVGTPDENDAFLAALGEALPEVVT